MMIAPNDLAPAATFFGVEFVVLPDDAPTFLEGEEAVVIGNRWYVPQSKWAALEAELRRLMQ